MTKTLAEMMALSKAAHDGGTPQRAALESALRELIADAQRIEQKTAERCREMALWPQGIDDDEQAYYGRIAEFIEREFKLDAARQSTSI
jgi:hypothetical protein